MRELLRVAGIALVFLGLALLVLGLSLAALVGSSESSGAACVVIFFIPVCFSWGSDPVLVGVVASAISLVLLLIFLFLVRRALSGLTPGE